MKKKEKAIKKFAAQKANIGTNNDVVNDTWAAFTVELTKEYFGHDSYLVEHAKTIGLRSANIRAKWIVFLDECTAHIQAHGVFDTNKQYLHKAKESIASHVGKYLAGVGVFVFSLVGLLTDKITEIVNAFFCR